MTVCKYGTSEILYIYIYKTTGIHTVVIIGVLVNFHCRFFVLPHSCFTCVRYRSEVSYWWFSCKKIVLLVRICTYFPAQVFLVYIRISTHFILVKGCIGQNNPCVVYLHLPALIHSCSPYKLLISEIVFLSCQCNPYLLQNLYSLSLSTILFCINICVWCTLPAL